MAVVGSGIAGLAAAHALQGEARVTLFEAGRHFGGHAHTVDVTLNGVTHGVDCGFLVFNHRTYPNLVRLFDALGVETAASDMSFSVQARADGLEWSGCNLDTVFAQRRNLLRPRFLRMLADIARFNRLATGLASRSVEGEMAEPIAEFLRRNRFSDAFRDWYLLPMVGCIWSCPTDRMLRFPVATLIRFCHNHGLLQVTGRPQWYTVRGGARNYVARLLAGMADARLATPVRSVRRLRPNGPGTRAAGVMVATDTGSERYDEVILACHSDQSLALLKDDVDGAERSVLGAIGYHANRAVLHTDTAVLPQRRRAWAAWNYARAAIAADESAGVCLHYLINRLQPLPWARPVIVSLNPDPACAPDPTRVIASHDYSHPVFDDAAIRAQQQLPALQGRSHLWYCGAWTRYGFHEDGLASALNVVERLRVSWQTSAAAERAAA